MTDYRTINVVKRKFRVRVALPVRASEAVTIANADDTRVTRNDDVRITRNNDIRIAHKTTTTYPRIIHAQKRRFKIRGRRQV